MDAPSGAATGKPAATRKPATVTDTDTDSELFTEQYVEPPCEHPSHRYNPVHADGNPHYARLNTPCHHGPTGVYVVCSAWLDYALSFTGCECGDCGMVWPIADAIKDLGPVADYHRA